VRLSLALAAGLALAGCLPSSQRQIDRTLVASDSASAALAALAPVDTLALAWSVTPDLPLAMGVAWLLPGTRGARLAVVETQAGGIHLFGADGRAAGTWTLAENGFPYLAGVEGDTVVVLRRGDDRLDWIARGGVVKSLPTPGGASHALVHGSRILVRLGGGPDGDAPRLARLDRRGQIAAEYLIDGAPWRATGYLRPWGDDVLALSGYRPVVDVWTPASTEDAPLDTLALAGFASPLLGRSAQYLRGDVDEPPLLASSAAALGDRLFVLNLRDDGVRVDVYGRDGRIERVLVGPEPIATRTVVAVDLAVRAVGDAVEIAVLSARPGGLAQIPATELTLYRWRP
jgi:hypothetical protein